nr:uncharacterized protein si:ch211-274k16.9 [Danio rerio]|eukprot:XP_699953.2 uncharacterized protein si:ch211-274k16.9 [Danio rerio]
MGLTFTDIVSLSVMKGDSVNLCTGVQTNQQEDVTWYFNGIHIAQINGDVSFSCTDVQCNEGTEKFRDRLKLDVQTGSLTIMNINTTHSGKYHLVNSNGEKIFNVTVHDDPAGHQDDVKENEGQSVTFRPAVIRKLNDVLTWYFLNILIAEITVNQSQICRDVQCKERFTDRLKLQSESGSLTIMNIRITDSGEYTLVIFTSSNKHFSITREKRFTLTVISLRRSHLTGGAVAGIVVSVLLVVALVVAAVIYRRRLLRPAPPPPPPSLSRNHSERRENLIIPREQMISLRGSLEVLKSDSVCQLNNEPSLQH